MTLALGERLALALGSYVFLDFFPPPSMNEKIHFSVLDQGTSTQMNRTAETATVIAVTVSRKTTYKS